MFNSQVTSVSGQRHESHLLFYFWILHDFNQLRFSSGVNNPMMNAKDDVYEIALVRSWIRNIRRYLVSYI